MLINGRYETAEMLGAGLLAQTYAARDNQTGAEVVLKQITLKGMPGWKPFELFEREVAVLKTVSHPGVPRFVDAFQTEEGGTLAMALVVERVPGESLLARIERRYRWEEVEARGVLTSLLGILDHLHGLSPPVIHRDVKPSNIIMRPDGSPVLIDFGAVPDLAARMGDHSFTVVGTAGYLPPEQAMGAPVPASDIFALGATMVHALTHCHPADLEREGLRLVFEDRVGCSWQLTEILRRMVEPDLNARYPRASAALRDLEEPPEDLAPRYQRRHMAVRRPVAIELPDSPRALTKGAAAQVEQVAFFKAVKAAGAVSIGILPFFFGFAYGNDNMGFVLGLVATSVAAIFGAGRAIRRRHLRRYLDVYRNGTAVRGQVRSIEHANENGTLYADVKYTYEVGGKTHEGEIHYSGAAARQLSDNPGLLVVYDPARANRHIAMVVSP